MTFYLIRKLSDYTSALLTTGDSVFVAKGVVIGSDLQAFWSDSSHNTVVVQGDVVGYSPAISLGYAPSQATQDLNVTVSATGSVSGLREGYGAIVIEGFNSRIENAGDIWGADYGIYFNTLKSSSTNSVIHNTGTITGNKHGIVALGTEKLVVVNTGLIYGHMASFSELSNAGGQQIVNRGTMDGDVLLGGGTDFYDGRKGVVEGVINAGAGNDRVYGGSQVELINSGTGNDFISGGGGKDVFIFDTPLNKSFNVDTILDFSHADDTLQLENAVFIDIKAGNLDSAAFKLISSATSTAGVDADDRILYDKANGDLYYDRDGSGTAYGRVLFAHVPDATTIDRTDFLIV